MSRSKISWRCLRSLNASCFFFFSFCCVRLKNETDLNDSTSLVNPLEALNEVARQCNLSSRKRLYTSCLRSDSKHDLSKQPGSHSVSRRSKPLTKTDALDFSAKNVQREILGTRPSVVLTMLIICYTHSASTGLSSFNCYRCCLKNHCIKSNKNLPDVSRRRLIVWFEIVLPVALWKCALSSGVVEKLFRLA